MQSTRAKEPEAFSFFFQDINGFDFGTIKIKRLEKPFEHEKLKSRCNRSEKAIEVAGGR